MNSALEPLFASLRTRIAADPTLPGRDLLSLVRPSVRLATQRVTHSRIALGQSRIGGIPDVPTSFQWPRWLHQNPRDGNFDKFGDPWRPTSPVPLGFIAQIDLSDIPQVDDLLPDSGWLYFFYDRYCETSGFDPADRGCCRVIYANCDRSSLLRSQPPSDADREHIGMPCRVEAWPELTLPDELPDLTYGFPRYDSYRQLCDELTRTGGPLHRLLGHPQLVQNPMELECQLVSNGIYCGSSDGYQSEEAKTLETGAGDWRLLLQIDTDDAPAWMWGDMGRIYFWIKQQDLTALRFSEVWLILQCS